MLHTSLLKNLLVVTLKKKPKSPMFDKTSLLEKTMDHKKIPFKNPNKSPYKSFPKNPRMIRKT